MCAVQRAKVPIPTAGGIQDLFARIVLQHSKNPQGRFVVSFSKEDLKKANKIEKHREILAKQAINTASEEAVGRLIDRLNNEASASSSSSEPDPKRRKRDYDLFEPDFAPGFTYVSVDATRAYSTLAIRRKAQSCSRFFTRKGPRLRVWQGRTCLFGNLHSVTAWVSVASGVKDLINRSYPCCVYVSY
jgi:hypothetical protein